jgi:CubicO group peptidase (beta-lactamase class C family)
MRAVNELGPFSGVILVAKDGQIIASEGYGMADLEFQVRNSPETRFRIASVTKPITATAILLLAEGGKLSVHDPIHKYLPDCPEAWKAITIHHLLTHTSGLPEYFDLPGYDEKKRAYAGAKDFIEKLGSAPIKFAPGKEHKYANSNYILLGFIIEAASGKTYGEFLRQRIFEPAGMANTGCDDGTTIIRNRAAGYSWEKDIVPAEYFDARNSYASGNVYSTAGDLLRFVEALAGGRLVNTSTLDAMLTPQKSEYGYGWFITNWNGRHVVMHGGGMNGVKSDVKYLPDERVCVVVLSNIDVTKVSQIGEVLMRVALGESYEAAAIASPIDTVANLEEVRGDASVAEACVGVYTLPMGEFVVSREGEKLFLKTPEDPYKAQLQRESDMRFFIRGPAGVQVTFIKNDEGRVDEVKLTVRGREFVGKRKR